MDRRSRDEKMLDKKWDEMQKYKEFNKENFKSVDKFANIFNKIFHFFRYTFLGICILAIIIIILIYILYVLSLNSRYL